MQNRLTMGVPYNKYVAKLGAVCKKNLKISGLLIILRANICFADKRSKTFKRLFISQGLNYNNHIRIIGKFLQTITILQIVHSHLYTQKYKKEKR